MCITTEKATGPNQQIIERDPIPQTLRRFIWDIQSMIELAESEREILLIGRDLMTRLFLNDDWLPTVFGAASMNNVNQFHIYHDTLERFSIVSTILAGGTTLLIEQHSVWEIMGVSRGSVTRRRHDVSPANKPPKNDGSSISSGSLATFGSRDGGHFELANALGDDATICIQVYGGEIDKISRRSPGPDGQMTASPLRYANGDGDPPYDIFSIQSDIRD